MAICFAASFGLHEQTPLMREQRAEVLANNLANADTPNYQARDLGFRALVSVGDAPAKPKVVSPYRDMGIAEPEDRGEFGSFLQSDENWSDLLG